MKSLVAAALLFTGAPAAAEVVNSGAHGFELAYSVKVALKPADALAAFANVARWWDSEHTYSGHASNLSLTTEPGGCFCERFPAGGGIEHLRVTYADPGKRIVLTGGLGPLLYEATSGVMDVKVTPDAGGSTVSVNYRVAGFANGGAAQMAALVDRVVGGMVERYRAFADKGR